MKHKESKSKFVSAARARFFQKTRGTSNISPAEHVFDTSASLQLKWRSLLQQSPDYANLVEYTFLHFTSFCFRGSWRQCSFKEPPADCGLRDGRVRHHRYDELHPVRRGNDECRQFVRSDDYGFLATASRPSIPPIRKSFADNLFLNLFLRKQNPEIVLFNSVEIELLA